MSRIVKIACVQMDVRLGDKAKNLRNMETRLRKAAKSGANLVIFPECSLTGYCFESLEEALPHAESIPGDATETVQGWCEELNIQVVFGLLEADALSSGETNLYNACVLVGPTGVVGKYRKVHLPFLGVDMFTTPGDKPFCAEQADGIKVGMNICYDAAFPEAARALALSGAELIVLPTNWPPGADNTAEHTINSRALENHVYYAAVNRVGEERGFRFIGNSKICDPYGNTIAVARHTGEAILHAEIDLDIACNKNLKPIPGKYEISRFADRRPELYDAVVAPKSDAVQE